MCVGTVQEQSGREGSRQCLGTCLACVERTSPSQLPASYEVGREVAPWHLPQVPGGEGRYILGKGLFD